MGEFNLFFIITGAIINFVGWGLYRLSLKVSGVVLGVIIGVLIGMFIITSRPSLQDYSVIIFPLAVLILGIIGQIFMKKLNMVAMFVIGAAVMIVVGERFLDSYLMGLIDRFMSTGSKQFERIVLHIILGILGGILAVILQKYIFILATSIIGSLIVYNGLGLKEESLTVFTIILILGIASQVGLFRWLEKKYEIVDE